MRKVDISITKSFTLPTGNYGNVRPGIIFTIKDVPMNEVDSAYREASEVADALLGLEAISLMEEAKSVDALGYSRYLAQLVRAKDTMLKIVEAYAKKNGK
jgi:hypothetical protein